MASKLSKKSVIHYGYFVIPYIWLMRFIGIYPTFSEGNNLENTFRSVTTKPFGYLKDRKNSLKTDSLNIFKSITDRQDQ